ncbi:MAG: AmmeMemoRadiSam system protein B [Leptothrix sp. (in: Bacteria)]|nr:AmmeMemoRadiSam system protein B [Leptothrix sp. (in: b-proteobacteria)]
MPTRHAVVAGSLYPACPQALQLAVAHHLGHAPIAPAGLASPPKLLVVPHGSYARSGDVAARAFALLAPQRGHIRRVVLLGPAHRAAVHGLAAPVATAFETPLGSLAVDHLALAGVADLPQMCFSDEAHDREHGLEVQLPFLQTVLGSDIALLPLLVGDCSPEAVDEVLDRLWGDDDTLIVVSSGLSRHLPYAEARLHDQHTVQRMLACCCSLGPGDACGAVPLNGALLTARRHGLLPRLLDLRTSADSDGGNAHRVAGYCALAFFRPQAFERKPGALAAAASALH